MQQQRLMLGVPGPGVNTIAIPGLVPCPLASPTAAQLTAFALTGWPSAPNSFSGPGDPRSQLDSYYRDVTQLSQHFTTTPNNYITDSNGHRIIAAAVYDTGSWQYEQDGINQGPMLNDTDNGADEGTNGQDDNGDGVVDDPGELECCCCILRPATWNSDEDPLLRARQPADPRSHDRAGIRAGLSPLETMRFARPIA